MTKIICIGGKAQHGKDTSAKIFFDELKKDKNVIIAHYADLLKFICKTYFGWDGNKDEQGRTLLQHVGTEVIREQLPDYWVDFVINVVNLFPNKWDYIIIPDARFPNELHKWKEAGYRSTYVKVIRENFISPLTLEQQKHQSEIALDNEIPDYILYNNSTIENLKTQIHEICKNL